MIYHRGTNCFFLPGFAVVCLKCSCVSFFFVGANWSFFTKLDTFWLDVVAVIDTCAWVSSVITLSNVLWSLMSFIADAISDVSCCIVLLVASTAVKVNNNDMQIIISTLTGCFLIFFWRRNTQCDTEFIRIRSASAGNLIWYPFSTFKVLNVNLYNYDSRTFTLLTT